MLVGDKDKAIPLAHPSNPLRTGAERGQTGTTEEGCHPKHDGRRTGVEKGKTRTTEEGWHPKHDGRRTWAEKGERRGRQRRGGIRNTTVGDGGIPLKRDERGYKHHHHHRDHHDDDDDDRH